MEYQKIILIAAQEGDNPKNGEKEVVFKNCTVFTDSQLK